MLSTGCFQAANETNELDIHEATHVAEQSCLATVRLLTASTGFSCTSSLQTIPRERNHHRRRGAVFAGILQRCPMLILH